ncbi:cilia- and flagella-associated protein 99 [Pholidichthys leucotaenia]
MAQGYGQLAKEAIVLLDKFRAGRQSLDDFVEDVVKDLQNMESEHRNFILDIVSGCTEHKKLLDVVINAFYDRDGRWLSRGDRSQFVIICYLVTFALDDLGLQPFSSIVQSLDTKKILTFLSFFFSNLMWIREEWNNIYDDAFVEKHWIGPLLRWRPEIERLMDQAAVKLSQGGHFKKVLIKTTEPQEFSFTKPKPRPLPMPELIPLQEKYKPVPSSIYRTPKEMHLIEKSKQKNHQKAEELLLEANLCQFRCGNPQKSEHTKRVILQIEEDLNSKLKFNSFHSSGPPPNLTKSSSIKLNNAAILRTKALCDRQVKEELHRIEQLMQGGREPSAFLQWQREMLEKDSQLPQIECRHLEARISEKKVALIRHQLTECNQKAAQLKKEETAQVMKRYAEKRLQEEKAMRDWVQQVAEGHKNSKVAKEKIQKLKQSIVKEVSEQSRELLHQALEEAQAEMSRKFKLIHEIHSIESLPHPRLKNFDETETAGHELLDEMSLAELKERLAILREAQQAEREEKRRNIKEEKQKKKQQLLEEVDAIDLHRKALAQATAIRKEGKKARLELFQQVVAQDETVLALRKKLEEITQECQKLKEAENSKTRNSKHQ